MVRSLWDEATSRVLPDMDALESRHLRVIPLESVVGKGRLAVGAKMLAAVLWPSIMDRV